MTWPTMMGCPTGAPGAHPGAPPWYPCCCAEALPGYPDPCCIPGGCPPGNPADRASMGKQQVGAQQQKPQSTETQPHPGSLPCLSRV
eukprot:CAMPEP_0180509978 /NCGR_PEP_ID=MMETSP1036_2-20121128/50024_1 /TAXON_ID=632150 /ORGANISM="Azadinium spinosum, Strain 3D9" /LENGTH=86 /DNA_ID=CAMNT_0022520449 /DNA_START=154 /DNA_END=414 /DNA_ORIENTATION=+